MNFNNFAISIITTIPHVLPKCKEERKKIDPETHVTCNASKLNM